MSRRELPPGHAPAFDVVSWAALGFVALSVGYLLSNVLQAWGWL